MTRTAIAVTTALGIFVASPSFAEESETIAFEKLSHEQRTAISTAGEAAIRGITEARVSLERNDGPGARRALGEAAEQLRLIRERSPSASLGAGLEGLHDQLVKGEDGDAASLTPIYARLDAYQDVVGEGSAEELRVKLDGAKGKLAAGEDEEAAVMLEAASDSIRYVEIDLPVKQTLASVERAISQVGSQDFLGADGNLRASLGSLQTFSEMASIQTHSEMEDVGAGPAE